LIKRIDISKNDNAEEILAIQIPSYRKEAELIEYYDLPPLKDTVKTIQQCGETFYGYYINGKLCGVIAIKVDKGVIDIHRLFVSPLHFRKGIAKELLKYIQTYEQGANKLIVSTGSKNLPALNFYIKNGFTIAKEVKIAENLLLTLLQKEIISVN
jgi:GNAT superfamily N-acetyltransferase